MGLFEEGGGLLENIQFSFIVKVIPVVTAKENMLAITLTVFIYFLVLFTILPKTADIKTINFRFTDTDVEVKLQ